MKCPKCNLEHRGWVTCAKARFDATSAVYEASINKEYDTPWVANNVVANTPEVANNTTVVANRHGVYADKEKRKAYMRELMRKRRSVT